MPSPALPADPRTAPDATAVLALIAEHLQAHPHARGDVALSRFEPAYDRTVRERASVAIAPAGARLVLPDASTEIAIDARHVEVFDGSTGPGMIVVEPLSTSPLAAYAAIAAGGGLEALFAARLLERARGRAVLELFPRTPWTGLERIIVRVVEEGASRGRVERALWLDGRGGWQRADLEALSYPAALDARSITLSPHPDARRLEL